MRVGISLVIYVAWIAITLVGAVLITQGDTSLDELVSSGICWHFAVAIALLLVAIWVFKWRDMAFSKPHALIRVMWFPMIYLVLFAGGVSLKGLPPLSVVTFVIINTLMVGASEEIMFRGVLFRAFKRALPIWPAIVLTSILFGAVHTMNVFITGALDAALVQSVAAGMTGVIFLAIVIRTGSIWPAIVYHFLWDCLLFLLTTSSGTERAEASAIEASALAHLIPILLNVPNLIFALFLLRHVGKES